MPRWEVDVLLMGLEREAGTGGREARPSSHAPKRKATGKDIKQFMGRWFGGRG